ncbi:hypothetical protein RND71_018564 [Anisodus tanguticus]|uniref:Uncharacterized protein n=1 Tax=Anisodus tanguticus TaxID=243964 RepID=A0AAE1VB44_9SOLA|nr:hypothetical protein RND71_018564 [Anisodus tanguticus]
MDILRNVVSGFVVEVGKYACRCIYPKIENTIHFSSNLEILRKEMEELTKFRDDIKEKVKREGYKPKPNVPKWLEDVHKLEGRWESMQESVAAAKTLAYKYASSVCSRPVHMKEKNESFLIFFPEKERERT